MRAILFLIFFVFVNFNSYELRGEDALTIKQQLDRINQNLSDLNKAVFNKSFDSKNLNLNDNEQDVERFTSIDIRIYDLENDIKNLTLQFEEIIFKLDDLSNYIQKIETEINLNLESLKNSETTDTKVSNNNGSDDLKVEKEENTLGKLVLSENKSEIINEDKSTTLQEESVQNKEIDSMSAEEQLQFALDQMTKKKYENSKIALEKFITKFPDNQLSGSAHYWLGKIYLFESNFRKAAIVFGEGVQKFPNSIKAPEMYYELSKSLKEMNKFTEACKTLDILKKNYKGNKFSNDPEKIKNSLKCNDEN